MEAEVSNLAWLPGLLQTADPLFPTGAYAHSHGFEELARARVVCDEPSFTAFLSAQMLPVLEGLELPYLRFAYSLFGDLQELCSLDREIDAIKLAAEARHASTQIGVRRLAALRVISTAPELTTYWEAIQEGRACGHHVCVSALQARVQGTPLEPALLTYAYQTLAGACSAALKLIRIGQEGVQRALGGVMGELPPLVKRSLCIARADAGCFSPLLEIAAMRHAHADVRMFIS